MCDICLYIYFIIVNVQMCRISHRYHNSIIYVRFGSFTTEMSISQRHSLQRKEELSIISQNEDVNKFIKEISQNVFDNDDEEEVVEGELRRENEDIVRRSTFCIF
jgi:hypothetical protein